MGFYLFVTISIFLFSGSTGTNFDFENLKETSLNS